MTCRRAFDADLLAVLRGEEADADFVAHYPSCPDCAAEVRVWGELEGMLRAGTPVESSHPEPAALLAFVDAPATLAAAARTAVEGHLATCRACAEEVRTLRGFDAAQLVAAGAASAASAPPVRPTRERPADDDAPTAGGWLGRLVWHPAFAYALVAVLLVPLLRDQLPRVAEKTRAVDARRIGPALPPASERDASAPPAAMAKRERGAGGFEDAPRAAPEDAPRAAPEDAPRPAPNAAAPLAPMTGLAAGAPRPPAQALAVQRVDEMAVRKAQGPAPAARSGDDQAMRALAPEAGQALSGQLGDQREREVASAAAPPPGGASAPVLEIAPMGPTIVPYAAAARGVLLRVVPPTDLADGPLDVRVRGRANQHEIATRVTDRAGAIEVRIPASWLVPGDYAVTLQPVDGAGTVAGAPAILGFTVRAPTAP
jgi:anti-sigma factor RsiW